MTIDLHASTKAELFTTNDHPGAESSPTASEKASSSSDNTFNSISASAGSTDKVDPNVESLQITKLGSNLTPHTPLPTVNPSIMAQHGSVLSNPKADGLKIDSSFPFPKARGRPARTPERWNDSHDPQAHDHGHIKEDPSEVTLQSTQKSARVIALDFDDVCCRNMLALAEQHNILHGGDRTM